MGCHRAKTPAAVAVAAAATAKSTHDTGFVCHMARSVCACRAARACRVFCFTRSKRTCMPEQSVRHHREALGMQP